MRSQIAPDVFKFAKELQTIVSCNSREQQALAFHIGIQFFRLTPKTMASIVKRDPGYVYRILRRLVPSAK